MVNTTDNSTQEMIKKVSTKFKRKNKVEFYENISNYYDERNFRSQSGTFQFEQDPFSENFQGIGKIYQEVLLLMTFLKTKPQGKSMNKV